MTISLLYGCCQIETCARDLDAARAVLVGVLGGAPAEQELARQISALIPGDAYDVEHIECGQAIFQINRPSPDMTYNGQKSVHQRYLDAFGPVVTNLNFFVDDIEHARECLGALGATTHIEGPSSAALALGYYGPHNTRSGGDARPFLFMGSRHLIGFDLELMEPNFLRFTRQTVQFPAFVAPRPVRVDGDLRLHRLIVSVPDLDGALRNLERIFAPASRSKPYAVMRGADDSFRVGLGGIEIEYCAEVIGAEPGIPAIAFGTADPSAIASRAAAQGLTVEARQIVPGVEHLVIDARPAVGFAIILEPHERPLSR